MIGVGRAAVLHWTAINYQYEAVIAFLRGTMINTGRFRWFQGGSFELA